jgi:hypothetical protein
MQATRNARKRSGALGGTEAIVAAARRNRVPIWVLAGVKLMETGSGAAANPFQFEPGAARQAGVRDVNNFGEAANGAAKLLASYKRQFGSWNAAFEAYNGGPGAVGKGYAYNESDVKAKLAEFHAPGTGARSASFLPGIAGEAAEWLSPGGVGRKLFEGITGAHVPGGLSGNPAEAIPETLEGKGPAGSLLGSVVPSQITEFFAKLGSGELWLRVGEVLAGAILLYLGLRTLTGIGASSLPGAKAASAGARLL